MTVSPRASRHPETGGCGDAIHSFTDRFGALANTLGWLTLLPGLIGVMLAAPTILELENGTHRLAWTQSITRRRWIAVKLLVAVLTASAAAGILILLLTWWRGPLDRLSGRMERGPFDSQGTVALGYTLFALGLALAIGVVWRRAVPAIMVAFGAYVAARVFVDTSLRQHFEAPLSATWPVTQPGPDLSHAWVLTQHPSNSLGQGVPVHLSSQGICLQAGSPTASATADPGSHTRSTSPRAASGSSRASRPRSSAASRSR